MHTCVRVRSARSGNGVCACLYICVYVGIMAKMCVYMCACASMITHTCVYVCVCVGIMFFFCCVSSKHTGHLNTNRPKGQFKMDVGQVCLCVFVPVCVSLSLSVPLWGILTLVLYALSNCVFFLSNFVFLLQIGSCPLCSLYFFFCRLTPVLYVLSILFLAD